jgi:NADH-quinone oxidoreductase subunit F
MNEQAKILTANWDKENSQSIEVYEASGGYQAARKAFEMDPGNISQEVLDAGLRGRGGAGFPAGRKWMFMPKETDRPKYLCVNADEGEPGTFKDREIMIRDPHMLIEGIIIASRAMGAHNSFIYIRGEFSEPARIMEKAVTEAYEKGYLGKGVLGTDFNLDVFVHIGAGAYICGEETALIESIEGHRGNPRIRPPFPPQRGVFNLPTTVNNVETIASVPYIIQNGSQAYRKFGTEKSPGTKLFCISGHVNNPGVYELPLGFPLMALINDVAGGMLEGMELKAVIPGGSSTPVLKADECEGVNLDYESLQAAGSMLGCGAVIVMAKGTCMVKVLEILSHFYAHESCGQCTPCREGTGWISQIINRIHRGQATKDDIDLAYELACNMEGRTICPLADAAAAPVKSFITKFREEFEAHVENKGCPLSSPIPVTWK